MLVAEAAAGAMPIRQMWSVDNQMGAGEEMGATWQQKRNDELKIVSEVLLIFLIFCCCCCCYLLGSSWCTGDNLDDNLDDVHNHNHNHDFDATTSETVLLGVHVA